MPITEEVLGAQDSKGKRSASSTAASSKKAKDGNGDASTTTTTAVSETKSPWKLHQERLRAVAISDDSVQGYMPIRGMPDSDSEDGDSGDDPEDDEITQEQIDHMRYVIVTTSRDKALSEMGELVLGDQADSNVMMFNTSFSYHVEASFHQVLRPLLAKTKSAAKKFDLLLAYTHTLLTYDVWMHDNEGGMDEMVKALAKSWKMLLKLPNDKLGITEGDTFTRPGVVCLLEDFKTAVESAYSEPPFRFNFQ